MYPPLCRKSLKDPDNCEDVVTQPEPDILKCEVKWALGNMKNKVSGSD